MPQPLSRFEHRLPYASELFGTYQPLLGWRSKRVEGRIRRGLVAAERAWRQELLQGISPNVRLNADLWVERLSPGDVRRPADTPYDPIIRSAVADRIASLVEGEEVRDPDLWRDIVESGRLDELLREIGREAREEVMSSRLDRDDLEGRLRSVTGRESTVAGLVAHLHREGMHDQLATLFSPRREPPPLQAYAELRPLVDPTRQQPSAAFDPLVHFDPKTDLDRIGLSPVGVVHLFRQFFFELDTFLGPPVQHIWLSPGASVELVEVSTRRSVVEHEVEQSLDTVFRSEREIVERDDIAEAVQRDNERSTRFGASVTAEQSIAIVSAKEQVSYELAGLERESRHGTHEHMRQQTDRLTSEIRRAYRTVFKAVTEVEETTSKVYALRNYTDDLINYELRRKMRQVGVQVQDLGTRLCWQTYVDDAGRELGVAKLFHLAAPPDFSGLGAVNELPMPGEYTEEVVVSIPLYDWEGWSFIIEVGDDPKPGANVALQPRDGYTVKGIGPHRIVGGRVVDVQVSHHATPPSLGLTVHSGDLEDGEQTQVAVPVTFAPSDALKQSVQTRNAELRKERDAEKDRLTREAYVKAARERIDAASDVRPRPFVELREEERVVVYRALIAQLLDVGVPITRDTRVMHVVSELIQSMFDVEQMLYFVAPEWWRPRLHRSFQSVTPELSGPPGKPAIGKMTHGGARKPIGLDEHVIGWGGVHERGRDNYYVTETSEPAPFGSSLGWLLQLDGDNMRNAFLNAPWVKAVIPIRPGRELAALNWLSRAEIESREGLEDRVEVSDAERETILAGLRDHDWGDAALNGRYAGLAAHDVLVIDALRYLALRIEEKYAASRERVSEDLGDGVTLNYLRPDRVFEHGFDPLEDGFRADPVAPYELFDQWVEVLPTDQVVAVEVEYDPDTGRLL